MKIIGNLCLYFIVFATIWSVALVFVGNADVYSWLAVIALSIIIALISNHYDGKHDYIAMGHIGGDIQNTAFKCSKCSKKYVRNGGICGKMSYKEVMKGSN